MDVLSGIGAVGNALTIAKTLRQIDKSYDLALLRSKIADLIDQLTDAKLSLTEAKDALGRKDAEIALLRNHRAQSLTLAEGDGGYKYLVNDQSERVGYPCCPSCLQTDGKVVKMLEDQILVAAKCPVCDKRYRPVTCYISSANNGGSPTTALARYQNQQDEARERAATENRDGWIDARYI